MDLGLQNKIALVSGASRGIGKAIAEALQREGCKVAAIARTRPTNGDVNIAADMTVGQDVDAAIAETVDTLGGIDVVIANVGKSFARDAHDMTDDDLQHSLDMNLWSSARVAQRSIPYLKKRGGGSITIDREHLGPRGRRRARLQHREGRRRRDGEGARPRLRARQDPRELDRAGIDPVRRRRLGAPAGRGSRGHRAVRRAGVAVGRFGTVEEVADAVAFIASPRASWVTGACLAVDGGQARGF